MVIISETLEKLCRLAVPYTIMVGLFLLNITFVSSSQLVTIDIPLTIMMVYYWAIYRPSLIPPLLVFLMGICFDVLSGWPIGLSSFILLILRQSVVHQRSYLTGQPFVIIWLGFAGVLSLSLILKWFIFNAVYWHWSALIPHMPSIVSAILIFPVISLILYLVHKVLPDVPDQYSAVS